VILGVGATTSGGGFGHLINGPSFEYETATTRTTSPAARLFLRLGRLPDRTRLRQLPVSRLLDDLHRYGEGERGDRALTSAVHRPQGRRAAVPRGIGVFFFVGGLNAMLIRTELLHPSPPSSGPASICPWWDARHDDDGDDDIGCPRRSPTIRAADDRRQTLAFPRIEAMTSGC